MRAGHVDRAQCPEREAGTAGGVCQRRGWGSAVATFAIVAASVGVLGAAVAAAARTPPRAVVTPRSASITDANVADRVLSARTKADHEALANYYLAQARAEEPRIDHYDRLFRAYMQLEGKEAEPLQRQARYLLRAARMMKQHDELLAQAHRTLAWQD
jgi:hypothetical protein